MTVHQYGPGVNMSRMPFRIDPMTGLHAAATLAGYGAALGTALTPLGEYDLGRGRLAMDEEGGVYLWWGDLWRVADSMDAALSALVQGCRPARVHLARPRAPLPERPMDAAEAAELARRMVVGDGADRRAVVALHPFGLGRLVHPRLPRTAMPPAGVTGSPTAATAGSRLGRACIPA